MDADSDPQPFLDVYVYAYVLFKWAKSPDGCARLALMPSRYGHFGV